ncbi:MAG: serine protease [Henriciella sp.]|nr:serine protease [Henriciella sp.]
MRRFVPDWVVYLLALGGVVWAVFNSSTTQDSPKTLPEAIEREGATLPPPSAFDERVLVQVSRPKDGIGTAFAINEQGQWLTARHVVDGCDDVALLVAPGQYVKVRDVTVSEEFDLALIETNSSQNPVALDMTGDLRVGTFGYHVGYPQGRPGEAASRLLSRSNLISNGERNGSESVLTWAETGRTRGLMGSLGGLSGGPVYDENGLVRGVIVAESPRRGRIYTASPEAVADFINKHDVSIVGERPRPFSPDSYGREADYARRNLQVVKVACQVDEPS